MAKHKKSPPAPAPTGLIKLDIGCGPNPREGFVGMDSIKFNDKVMQHDARVTPWPFADNSVSEAHCSHFLEHLTGQERVVFYNELYRVLVPVKYNTAGLPTEGFATIITPHWASNRAYGDFTHQWPPVAEMSICYLDPEWRKVNAPHTHIEFNPNGYNCHFACTYDYTLHQGMAGRNQEYVQMAVTFWKESAQDLIIRASAIKK
jgi:hypothetical protein